MQVITAELIFPFSFFFLLLFCSCIEETPKMAGNNIMSYTRQVSNLIQ